MNGDVLPEHGFFTINDDVQGKAGNHDLSNETLFSQKKITFHDLVFQEIQKPRPFF